MSLKAILDFRSTTVAYDLQLLPLRPGASEQPTPTATPKQKSTWQYRTR